MRLNIFGPDTVPQLNEVITALETDEVCQEEAFDGAVKDNDLPPSRICFAVVDFSKRFTVPPCVVRKACTHLFCMP
jgi:hypothetical protein